MPLSQSLADHEGKSVDGYTRSKEKCDNFCLPVNDQLKLSFTGKSKKHFFFKVSIQEHFQFGLAVRGPRWMDFKHFQISVFTEFILPMESFSESNV